MKLGANQPMGPLELIDLIGIDIHLAKTETLYSKLGDASTDPAICLKRWWRRVSGPEDRKGFLRLQPGPPVPTRL